MARALKALLTPIIISAHPFRMQKLSIMFISKHFTNHGGTSASTNGGMKIITQHRMITKSIITLILSSAEKVSWIKKAGLTLITW